MVMGKVCKQAILGVLCLLISVLSSAADWELQKDEEGVRVFTREIQIEQTSEDVNSVQMAFKGVVQVETSLEKLLDVMRDVPNFDKWLHNCYGPEIVEHQPNDTRIVYQKTETPWPTDDRDVLLKQWIEEKDGIHYLQMRNTEHASVPVSDDWVRVPYFDGYLSFRPVSETQVEVIYEAAFDSGGQIPAMIANMLIVDTPFNSLYNLREYVAAN